MPKDKFWKNVATAGAVIGGAWVLSEILKGLAKPVYRCPCCGRIIPANTVICPNCRTRVRW